MDIILYLIVGGVIGWLAGAIVGKDVPFGIIGNIVAGIIGAWIGDQFLSSFGPVVAGMAILPALLGALVFVLLLSFILKIAR